MIIVSSAVVLSTDITQQFNANNPLVGYQTLADASTFTADKEQVDHPVTNLANPFTYLRWKGTDASEHVISVDLPGFSPVDYIGIAGHNFGTTRRPVEVWIATSLDSAGSPDYQPTDINFIPPDDSPILVRLEQANYVGIQVIIGASQLTLEELVTTSPIPQAAVMFIGKLLTLPRRLYVGHPPITLNLVHEVESGMSDSGNFLGRIVTRSTARSEIAMNNVPPDYYRSHMKPWVEATLLQCFFFAWRPGGYPYEVAYCWNTSNAIPVTNQLANGFLQLSMPIEGVVR